MSSADVLIDAFGRIREVVHEAVDGLHPDDLAFQLEEGTNSIAWLVWHLTRVQDDHIADVAKLRQVWTAKGWDEKFDLPFTPDATGYGDGPADVAALGGTTAELLVGYHDEVYQQTVDYLRTVTDDDLPTVVDTRWDPPVTLGVRLVSVVSDDLQHAGAAMFLRGYLSRR
ncbi:MAG TPA: DUF664 domain-containing protein [Pseudonocardiaceae bacterium]|nr:DUF664 domain-containing protein [Pseudonocardiaceae bacterium]